ncbi:hypothetical protein AvCA_33970 [Azotobacter vinelandii CA]|uniref:Uncharacterized protein n=2 Tax=Azotobacter vinelandii TaxID=354 RepID=C1DPX6_AZOVD|nr:hypothetical protein Avin_33970 [Azotobacter vinelandii DJ]AGK14648.1 hypothetical protein AvCA_33970 [Azotobacter vinelandii CA]AGK21314.1 hypothetical protein AvCA6_33970 [Azotobacter vinelandii CA6]
MEKNGKAGEQNACQEELRGAMEGPAANESVQRVRKRIDTFDIDSIGQDAATGRGDASLGFDPVCHWRRRGQP